MSTDRYTRMFEEWESDPKYWVRLSALEFIESLQLILNKKGLLRKDLAARIGVKEPTVSKALNGEENLTLATMNKLAAAVGAAVHINVALREERGKWSCVEQPLPTAIPLLGMPADNSTKANAEAGVSQETATSPYDGAFVLHVSAPNSKSAAAQ